MLREIEDTGVGVGHFQKCGCKPSLIINPSRSGGSLSVRKNCVKMNDLEMCGA